MDLNTISDIVRPKRRDDLAKALEGDAWLAGGTWLFSEPQPKLRRLVDLTELGWEPLTVTGHGLSISATCSIAELDAFEPPSAWIAAALIGECCRSFLASFKIWNTATVGGNICLGLPAGPMISLSIALEGTCMIWTPDGGERRMPAAEFVTGPTTNALRRGEILRSVELPLEALSRRTAFRRATLTPLGRSGVLLTGTRPAAGGLVLTVTASTRRPVRIAFPAIPDRETLMLRLAADIPPALYYDDVHGRPEWRRHMTCLFADEIRRELGGDGR